MVGSAVALVGIRELLVPLEAVVARCQHPHRSGKVLDNPEFGLVSVPHLELSRLPFGA